MASTVRLAVWTGAPPASSAATNLKFNRTPESINAIGTPIPTPGSDGTHFSVPQVLSLEVTATDPSTMIANRTIAIHPDPDNGRTLWYKIDDDVYNRPTLALQPNDDHDDNDAQPDNYDAILTDPHTYDNDPVPTQTTGRNGAYVSIVVGISFLIGASGNNVPLPDLKFSYDEF